jgi:hypothetical protein
MPSVTSTFAVATNTLVAEKPNAKIKPSLVIVDNVLGGADALLDFNDIFTPSISNAVAAPVLTTVRRLRINIAAGTCVSIQDQLKDVEFLGLLSVTRGVLDANCIITVAYNFN